ncbi:MAG: 50S ribosome-binding GTPase [Candidatus Freyarchaeota archaeon]|nr:50S ribosome-binding GTPase [Candidatus Jordarchaeia archaeon]
MQGGELEELYSLLAMGEGPSVEFKRRLTREDLDADKRQKVLARLRLMTSEGEGTLVVGVDDIRGERWEVYGLREGEVKSSDRAVRELCREAGVKLRERKVYKTERGLVVKYVLEREEVDVGEVISLSFAGRVNAGKSTLIGVLLGGKLDDGRGGARAYLLKHPQELRKGQTADLHYAFIGFDGRGEVIEYEDPLSKEERARVLDEAKRIVTLVDAPGHAEYLKSMIRSILGSDSQYGVILIPAGDEYKLIVAEESKRGVARLDEITREHMLLMASRDTPFIVVISKIDSATPEALEKVRSVVRRTVKEIGRVPFWVREKEDVDVVKKEVTHKVLVPVVEVSCITGDGLDVFKKLLSTLPVTVPDELAYKPALAYIDKVYRRLRGTNVVVTGTVKQGVFKPEQNVKVGPDANGGFRRGWIASVEVFCERVSRVKPGEMFGFDIKKIDPDVVRRGQVVADVDMKLEACREFWAKIVVTRHPTKITRGYSPVLHCNTISQTVVFEEINGKDYLVVGDYGEVRLRLKYRPEYITVGNRIVTREGTTRTIGRVTEIIE